MSPFTVHSIDTAPEGSKATLAATTKAWGFTPTLQGTLAESPAALKAYEALFAIASADTQLSPALRQAVFLTASAFHGCEYCTMGHTYLARAAHLDEAAIAAIRAGDAPSDPRTGALVRFARAVLDRRGDVPPEVTEAFLGAGFSKANVLDVVTIIATKVISNYANHIAGTPKESFMSDPTLAWTAPAQPHAAA
jgi:uncharacterized peroxidase-related enzyme